MQTEAAEAFDVSREPQHIRDMYGPGTQARQILIARRLVERGVRFVQVWHGEGQPWDSHDDLEVIHRKLANQCDQAIGALLVDLKQRGLLDETLVVWGGEFGRTPFNEKGIGRDHNPWGFSIWMAGAGIKPGTVGTTDELGLRAQEKPYHVHDIHATVLHLMGLDHQRLTYLHNGRAERPTIVGGQLIEGALA
jgi:uncharacterized protein (DUF1501 family)